MEAIRILDPDVSFLDVAGHPSVWHGLMFVSTLLRVAEGWEDRIGLPLRKFTNAYLPFGLAQDGENILEDGDALWVRARLPMVFRFAPPAFRRTWRLWFLNSGFLALSPRDDEVGYDALPFVWSDVNLRAELRFGRAASRDERRRISGAFWDLLASEPDLLATYRDRVWLDDGNSLYGTTVGYWSGQFHLFGNNRGWE